MPAPVWSHSLMVRTPAFHAGDTGFESRWDHMAPSSNGSGRQPLKLQMLSSNLAGVTVAIVQRLVHQIVALKIRVLSPLRSGRRRTEVPRTSCAPVVTPWVGMPSGEGGGL